LEFHNLTQDEEKALMKTGKNMFKGKGPFSGTNVCECNGDVVYSTKGKDGTEIGACKECGTVYINHHGRRLPPIDALRMWN